MALYTALQAVPYSLIERNQMFEAYNDTIHHLREYLRSNRPGLICPTGPTVELFAKFLQSININDQASMYEFMDDFFESVGLREYPELEQEYKRINFDIVLYLLDIKLLGGVRGTGYATIQPVTSVQKTVIVMSALLWMRLLFPKYEWRNRLLMCPLYDGLSDHINWLVAMKQESFLKGTRQMNDIDKAYIDQLWAWLDQHTERPIRLAFAIANYRIERDVLSEMEDVSDIIMDLTDNARMGRRVI